MLVALLKASIEGELLDVLSLAFSPVVSIFVLVRDGGPQRGGAQVLKPTYLRTDEVDYVVSVCKGRGCTLGADPFCDHVGSLAE